MPEDDAPWRKKQIEYEEKKARAKALRLRLTCTICGARPKTLLNCPCGTTQYCSVDCQRIDWRDRGHRAACKKIRNERAAEAARAEAPTPPPSPPKEVFYGPAPRSHADEVRARITAEHEAARFRREANPEPEPESARFGSRCPICLEEWDVNAPRVFRTCCCRSVCQSCEGKIPFNQPCPLCRSPPTKDDAEDLARLRRHVENGVSEAIDFLGKCYGEGNLGLLQSDKKAAKLYKRAAELGNAEAMVNLGTLYVLGQGVKLDRAKAKNLWQHAATRAHPVAQCHIGHVLRQDGKADEAIGLYKLSAAQGYTQAEHSLAISYHFGIGVPGDFEEARRWYTRAAAKGFEDAKAALALHWPA